MKIGIQNMLIYYYYYILEISINILIKYFDRFMTNKTNHRGKKNIWYSSHCFSRSKALEYQTKIYLAINHKKSVLISKEDA